MTAKQKWAAADVPDQSGRVAIVTGANTGIGYGAAAVLADKGAHVVLAVRNLDKGNDAKARITAASPNAVVTVQELDLTSLDNIHKAASAQSNDEDIQRRLWSVSEELTGVTYPV